MAASFAYPRPVAGLAHISLPRFILLATSVCLFLGLGSLLAWLCTGRVECVRTFFVGPGALYLVFLAALEFSLCRMVLRQFADGEALRPAWLLIALSGGCHLVGAVAMQILSVPTPLIPLARGLGMSAATASDFYRFGLLVAGPVQMAPLAAGLAWMLFLARRAGIRPSFQPSALFPLGIAALLTWLQLSSLISAWMAGNDIALYDVMSASGGPLLTLLLVEASMVKSCMSTTGGGMIARCWNSFAVAIFLTAVSNLGAWLDSHGLLSVAPATINCFVTYLAATAYALGPAWQIIAIQSACGEVGVSRFSPVAMSLSALRLLNTARTHL